MILRGKLVLTGALALCVAFSTGVPAARQGSKRWSPLRWRQVLSQPKHNGVVTTRQRYRWKIGLLPTAVLVRKGHRLTLLIASQDSGSDPSSCFDDYTGGCYDPSGILPADSAGRAENTIHWGPRATKLRLHWVSPRRTQKPPRSWLP